jgi:uncharacterized cupin superfamily protein
MGVRLISSSAVEEIILPGRKMKRLVTAKSLGAETMSLGVIQVSPGETVRPCHAHTEEEEIIYIVRGQGEAWVDGEIAAFAPGDAILFPRKSKHMIRNTGREPLEVIFIFAPPTGPDKYQFYPEIEFTQVG